MNRLPLAGVLWRLVAAVLDLVLVLMLLAACAVTAGLASGLMGLPLLSLGGFAGLTLAPGLYFVLCEAHPGRGQTPGMRAVGIGVRTRDGRLPSVFQAAVRQIGWLLSLLSLGLGFLLAVGPSRRTLADRLSGTCIVQVPRRRGGA